MIKLYCDGSVHPGNPGPGGWGSVIVYPSGQVAQHCGYSGPNVTNNHCELTAVLEGLRRIDPETPVAIYTDSMYVINPFNKGWLANWQKNNWKTASKNTEVANKDLWVELANLVKGRTLTWHWVKGHSGDIYNEMADKLAYLAAELPPFRIGKTQIQTPEDALREANLQIKIEDSSITDEYLQKENLKPLLTKNPNAFWQLASTQGTTAEMSQAINEVRETMDGSGVEENPLLDLQLDLHKRPLQSKDLSPEAQAALKAMKKAPSKPLYTKADIPDLVKVCMDPEFDDWDTLVGQVDRRRENFETGSISLRRQMETNKIKQSEPYQPPKELLEKAVEAERISRKSSKF